MDRFDLTLATLAIINRLPNPHTVQRDTATLERVLQLVGEAAALLDPDHVDQAVAYFDSDVALLRCHIRALEIRAEERAAELQRAAVEDVLAPIRPPVGPPPPGVSTADYVRTAQPWGAGR